MWSSDPGRRTYRQTGRHTQTDCQPDRHTNRHANSGLCRCLWVFVFVCVYNAKASTSTSLSVSGEHCFLFYAQITITNPLPTHTHTCVLGCYAVVVHCSAWLPCDLYVLGSVLLCHAMFCSVLIFVVRASSLCVWSFCLSFMPVCPV